MSNTEQITVTGLVATTPRHLVTQDGLAITSFRLASSQKFFSVSRNEWVEETNWYTITTFKTLAINVVGSVNKGERILVQGAMHVRNWDDGERGGTYVEIEATSIGHDLKWGTACFTRTVMVLDDVEPTPAPAPKPAHSCNCEKCDK